MLEFLFAISKHLERHIREIAQDPLKAPKYGKVQLQISETPLNWISPGRVLTQTTLHINTPSFPPRVSTHSTVNRAPPVLHRVVKLL